MNRGDLRLLVRRQLQYGIQRIDRQTRQRGPTAATTLPLALRLRRILHHHHGAERQQRRNRREESDHPSDLHDFLTSCSNRKVGCPTVWTALRSRSSHESRNRSLV